MEQAKLTRRELYDLAWFELMLYIIKNHMTAIN